MRWILSIFCTYKNKTKEEIMAENAAEIVIRPQGQAEQQAEESAGTC